jgi:predicted ester cyclase
MSSDFTEERKQKLESYTNTVEAEFSENPDFQHKKPQKVAKKLNLNHYLYFKGESLK